MGKDNIPPGKIAKIYEGYHKHPKWSTHNIAKYAGVSQSSARNYLREAGLRSHFKPHPMQRRAVASLEILLDGIFDIEYNPSQSLSFNEILARLDAKQGKKVNREDLHDKIDLLLDFGFYEKVRIGAVTKYKAGMPLAMGSNVLEEKYEQA